MVTHQKVFCSNWKNIRNQIEHVLYILPADKLTFTPHQEISSMGRQLRHIADVAEVYIRGIETGRVDFSEKRRDRSMETSKEKLIHYIHQQTQSVDTFVSALPNPMLEAQVEFPELGLISVEMLLGLLIQHESMHLGILYTTAILADINVPAPL